MRQTDVSWWSQASAIVKGAIGNKLERILWKHRELRPCLGYSKGSSNSARALEILAEETAESLPNQADGVHLKSGELTSEPPGNKFVDADSVFAFQPSQGVTLCVFASLAALHSLLADSLAADDRTGQTQLLHSLQGRVGEIETKMLAKPRRVQGTGRSWEKGSWS